MLSPKQLFAGAVAAALLVLPAYAFDFGRPASSNEIKLWDIDVRPDGKGLPDGSGTVAHGKEVFAENCAACHGENGEGGIKDRLVGGQGTLVSDKPIKTVGSFWPYATTFFDYIHRAMPYQAPGSLSVDDFYALTAYILSLNGILPPDGKLDKETLPKVKMPNRDGFIPDPEVQQNAGAESDRNWIWARRTINARKTTMGAKGSCAFWTASDCRNSAGPCVIVNGWSESHG
jgi:S-disulfanyl-L-cysteine oxidoreductase SoxD